MEEQYKKQKKIVYGGFLKGFLKACGISIVIIILVFVIMNLMQGIGGVFLYMNSGLLLKIMGVFLPILAICAVFVLPVILGIFEWKKYKMENRRFALGYLIGSFMNIIVFFMMFGACGLMFA